MEERKNFSKGPIIGGCVVGLVIGTFICCVVVLCFFASFNVRQKGHSVVFERHSSGPYHSMSTIGILGRYELADADAVKEFNSRVKKWFVERGFSELEDIPLRSIGRIPSREGEISFHRNEGDWNKPGVLLLLKFDDDNSLYILVPDCYQREVNVQMFGYRSDFFGTADRKRDFEIQFDQLIDDFERTFPSSHY